MKVTLASIEDRIKNKGYEPVQIDGIPEGFSFKEPDITIGGEFHEGKYVAFIPLKEWDTETSQVWSYSMKGLLEIYKAITLTYGK